MEDQPPHMSPPLAPRKPYQGRVVLPPLEPRRLFTQRIKRVNIRYNPANPKEMRRVSNLQGRVQDDPEIKVGKYKNSEGYSHIVFDGNPNAIRNTLGTNDPLIESANENFMRSYRKTTIQPNYPIRHTVKLKSKSKPSSSLRNTLLRKTVQNTRNLSRRFKNAQIIPRKLDFS